MGKQKHGEVKVFVQYDTATNNQSWDLNPGIVALEDHYQQKYKASHISKFKFPGAYAEKWKDTDGINLNNISFNSIAQTLSFEHIISADN